MSPSARREQILVCAIRLFEQQRYEDVRLQDVADAAGVARPLVHHYFGTKRELHLEALRRLAFIPVSAIEGFSEGPLEERVESAFDGWLSAVERHRNTWLNIITLPRASGDPEVDQILRDADQVSAERIIQVMRLDELGAISLRLMALVTAFGGLARSSAQQWLIEGSLSKADVRTILTRTFLTLITEVAPEIGALPASAAWQ